MLENSTILHYIALYSTNGYSTSSRNCIFLSIAKLHSEPQLGTKLYLPIYIVKDIDELFI